MKKIISLIFLLVTCITVLQAQYKIVIVDTIGNKFTEDVWKIDNITFQNDSTSSTIQIDNNFELSINAIDTLYFEYSDSKLVQANMPVACDLGLSVNWSGLNLGASSESDAGLLVGWADITGNIHSMSDKYYPTTTPPLNIESTSYDLATRMLGSGWRMPTEKEIQELIDACDWKKTSSPTSGYMATSKINGKKIFFPITGLRRGDNKEDITKGYYWSAVIDKKSANYDAFSLVLDTNTTPIVKTLSRSLGLAIRPVCEIPTNAVRLWTNDPIEVSYRSATLSYKTLITKENADFGFCYSDKEIKNADFFASNLERVSVTPGINTYTLNELTSDHDYWYFCFVEIGGNYYTGEVKHFKTRAVDVKISLSEPDSLAVDYAQIPIKVKGNKDIITDIKYRISDSNKKLGTTVNNQGVGKIKTISANDTVIVLKKYDPNSSERLKPNHYYSLYVYAAAEDKTIYSNVIDFTTKSVDVNINVSVAQTNDKSAVFLYSLSGEIGGVTELYLKYSDIPIEKNVAAAGVDQSIKVVDESYYTLNGLEEGKTYYYFCYAKVDGSDTPVYSNGNVKSFTTSTSRIDVVTSAPDVKVKSAAIPYYIKGTIPTGSEYGLVYSDKKIDKQDLSSGETQKLTSSSGTVNLSGLTPETTYYYFVYLKSSNNIVYSPIGTFTTLSANVSVSLSSPDVSKVFYNTATLSYSIGGDSELIEESGLIYSKDPISKADISVIGTKIGLDHSKTSVTLTGLSGATKYYAFAYVKSNGTYKYSSIVSFETLDKLFEIVTIATSNVKSNSATFNLSVKGDPSIVKELGFVYSTEIIASTSIDIDETKMQKVTTSRYVSPLIVSRFEANQEYWCYCYIKIDDNNILYSEILNFKTINKDPRPAEAIDLGLSVKWSPWNFGALSEADYGGHYGWGDPTGELHDINAQYGPRIPNDSICGTEYDIAHVTWGDKWRIPTMLEVEELFEKCSKEYVLDYQGSGVTGYIYTGPNGNSIFMPYAGYRDGEEYIWRYSYNTLCMWTANTNELAKPWSAYERGGIDYTFGSLRDSYYGMTIRPVYDKDPEEKEQEPVEDIHPDADSAPVDLGLPSGNLWSNFNLGAKSKKSTEVGTYYRWGDPEAPEADETFYATDYKLLDRDYFAETGKKRYMNIGFFIEGSDNDAVAQYWGSSWELPTEEDFDELIENCNVEYTMKDGVEGNLFTSKINGKTLFFPLSGHKAEDKHLGVGSGMSSYWSATLYYLSVGNHSKDRDWALALRLTKSSAYIAEISPYFGCPIRPVKKKK